MKKLFTNDKFFLAMVLCAVIGEVVFAFIGIWNDLAIQSQLCLLFRVACDIALYVSYKRHGKNVMKGMMGALLATQLITAILYLGESYSPVDDICLPLFAIMSAFLFISHFLINAEHKSSPKAIALNQLLVILLFLNNTVMAVEWVIIEPSPVMIVTEIADIIGFLGMTTVVVCVESRLDAYRLDREAAGWTEEEGYPEGYVHEFEKNKK